MIFRRLFASSIQTVALILAMQGCHPPVTAPPPRVAAGLSDVEFAKSTFVALADGDKTVASDIDWLNFKAGGVDVGAKYKPFSDDLNRSAFQQSFISSYSASLKKTGADANSLTNWTLDKQDTSSATVTAATVNHTHVRVTLSKSDGERHLVGIEIAP